MNSEETENHSNNPQPAPPPIDYAPADVTRDFEPLQRAGAEPEAEEQTFGGDRDGIRQAADESLYQ